MKNNKPRYLIGTLFQQEEQNKKMNFHNKKATDQSGRVRFHGAFTGGFQAGYKNTCGSKQGWTPSSFFSSRSNRSKQLNAKITDYMDQQDIGKVRIQNSIKNNDQYLSKYNNCLELLNKNNSVGENILTNMKKIKLNLSQEQLFTQAIEQQPQQLPSMFYQQKYNHYGLGQNQNNIFNFSIKQQEEIKSTKLQLTNRITEYILISTDLQIKKPNVTINQLDQNQILDLDIVKTQQYIPRIRRKNPYKNSSKSCKLQTLFEQRSILNVPQQTTLILIPQNFVLPCDLNKQNFFKKHSKMDVQNRKQKLGQTSLKSRLSFVQGQKECLQTDQFLLFDQEKKQRFKLFVLEAQGKIVGGLQYNKYQEMQKQRNQFQQLYNQLKQKGIDLFSQKNKKQEVKSKLQNLQKKNRRQKQDRVIQHWFPDKLLCKRFGVQLPQSIKQNKKLMQKLKKQSQNL